MQPNHESSKAGPNGAASRPSRTGSTRETPRCSTSRPLELAPCGIPDLTFDLLSSSSSFELKCRRRTVEDRSEKIARAQESSLDPLSRSFPSFSYSPRLPHSLPRFANTHARSLTRSIILSRPPQSVAASFPPKSSTAFSFTSTLITR